MNDSKAERDAAARFEAECQKPRDTCTPAERAVLDGAKAIPLDWLEWVIAHAATRPYLSSDRESIIPFVKAELARREAAK